MYNAAQRPLQRPSVRWWTSWTNRANNVPSASLGASSCPLAKQVLTSLLFFGWKQTHLRKREYGSSMHTYELKSTFILYKKTYKLRTKKLQTNQLKQPTFSRALSSAFSVCSTTSDVTSLTVTFTNPPFVTTCTHHHHTLSSARAYKRTSSVSHRLSAIDIVASRTNSSAPGFNAF